MLGTVLKLVSEVLRLVNAEVGMLESVISKLNIVLRLSSQVSKLKTVMRLEC